MMVNLLSVKTALCAGFKRVLTMAFLSSFAMTMQAQVATTMTLQGVAVDRNGNPLKGVTIEAAGGITSTETADDGTFSMEVSRWLKSITASGVGLHNKTVKLKDNMNQPIVIKMKMNPDYDPQHLKGNMTLHGTILDKNGNPLPGAKIEAKKLNLNTITDADGSFSMEVPRSLNKVKISYPGLMEATVYLHGRADNPLILQMGKFDGRLMNRLIDMRPTDHY